MQKSMKIMLITVTVLFGSIFLYKTVIGIIIKKSMAEQSQIIAVSTMSVDESLWQPKLTASGSLRAINGVNVTTELAGMVQSIYFKPGATVNKNDTLVQLNADNDIAYLHALEANVELAKTTYNRDKAQYAIHAVSKQTLDTDAANLKNLTAQVAQQAAIVEKKTIKAPFTGRLGISKINLGQYINPGDTIVTLQTLDPMYVDFYLPQQELARIQLSQPIKLTNTPYPKENFSGKITTINPAVDISTRNVEVEATFSNAQAKLFPGMFATVEISLGEAKPFLTVPQTAVSFNPYGELVFLVHQTKTADQKSSSLTVSQHFVITGETRGDQIQIIQGLKKGDIIVTSGQLKLKNGSQIEVSNSITPTNNPNPVLKNDH